MFQTLTLECLSIKIFFCDQIGIVTVLCLTDQSSRQVTYPRLSENKSNRTECLVSDLPSIGDACRLCIDIYSYICLMLPHNTVHHTDLHSDLKAWSTAVLARGAAQR